MFLGQTWHASRATSITFDETFFLGTALHTVRDHKLDPRLVAAGVAPVPVILAYLPALAGEQGAERSNLWLGEMGDAQKILRPRMMTAIVFGLPLIITMFLVVDRRCGFLAATLAAGLLSGSPTILASGSLATTDLAFGTASFLAVLATASWLDRPDQTRFVLWAAAIGIAIAAKYSGVFLLPVSGLFLAWKEWALLVGRRYGPISSHDWRRLSVKVLGKYLALLALAAGSCWFCHLLQTSGALKAVPFDQTAEYSPWIKLLGKGPIAEAVMTFAHEWIPRPSPVEGIFFQFQHSGWGHSAYLMGNFSKFGWWYFFPCAFAFKSTPVELAITLFLIGVGIRAAIITRLHPGRIDPLSLTVVVSTVIFCGLMIASPLNLGQRYILPVYPLLILLGIDQLVRKISNRPVVLATIAAGLLAGQVVSSRSVSSDFLVYFNSFCGGTSHGRWLLVDSSLDWGQGLKELKRFQDDHPERLALKYFGTALPQDYGVRAFNVDEAPLDVDSVRYFAISATYLQGDYTLEVDPFHPLRQLEADAKAGESILIYDLEQPDRRKALAASLAKLPDSKTSGEFLRWTSWRE
ncbi:hypothetical protein Pan44_27180 [Caulifigura coniformis]|uniref:Glycosyltransferase RgtA/B/C/D-like domain-containing protein n=1 Tax=Caulifigura coniformis TaxID=2527983 RepID=A0A517SEX3_9PLAN|nr:hypothetical protein Pan44_27180 [Caulifigura coniformis]